MRTLKENPYLWTISYISWDDGHTINGPVFSSKAEAELELQNKNYGPQGRVIQTWLWEENGKFYKIPYLDEVLVDVETHKRNALNKLSPEEKRSLGIK